ncbi:MAG: ABC transporter permease [Alphaproteobacteria bacterium]|nr:ABC transporter permease [Alphaproteobacteria bacterium]
MSARAASVPAFDWGRVDAMLRRHWYLVRGSWPRIVDLVYWPVVQMLVWGFLTQFMATNSSWIANAFGVLLAGMLLWDACMRSQLSLAICFLEEIWSRNLGHLFVSPLRPAEWIAALMIVSGLRAVVGAGSAMLLCIPLYAYSIFDMGLPFIAFFLALTMTGWAIGLAVSGFVMRQGMGAENVVWGATFLIAPVSCVYYPVETLPGWLQWVAWSIPSTPVFEGMRGVIVDGVFKPELLAAATALNAVYLALGAWYFLASCRKARERGQILQTGE